MKTFWTLDTRHILGPHAFCFCHWLTFATAYCYEEFLFLGNRLAFAKIQLIEGITMTLKQLCLFDGEVTMTRESTWIMFIVEISISRRKAFRHPARS